MAAADTCCMRGGWDLSFLDSEAARLSSSSSSSSCRQGDFHHRRSPCRGTTTTTTTARVPLCCPSSVVPLHSIVRRGSSSHSSRKVTPPPQTMTSSGSRGATCPSPIASTNIDTSTDHVYENQTTSNDIMRTIVSRGVPCRSTTSSSSSSSSSCSDDDLPTTTTPLTDDDHTSTSSSFLQAPPSICRSSRSPAVIHTSLVFPPPPEGTAFTHLLTQTTQTNGDVYARVTRSLTFWDDDQLSTAFHRLTLCHFYLGKLSFDEAKVLLRRHPVGTFLLRDSSDDRFPFALSVQTRRGTTSIRIVCECGGRFRLDCEPEQVHLMPSFDCVVGLIQFYVRQGGERRTTPNNLVLQEMNGRKDLPVLLRRSYETEVASLAHLCRKRINGIMGRKSVSRLQLLPSLKDYLNDYPYEI